jgi:hypothetical protein
MESIKCIVIQNESNTNNFCITDIIRKINNNTTKCEHIFIEIFFNGSSFIIGNLDFTPEENTLYIPKKFVPMFEGVDVVDIKLIDTKNIPCAKKIIIQQLSCELNSMKHRELIDKLFENRQLVAKGLAYNDGQINFLVKDILTSDNKSVPHGISAEGVIIETHNEHVDVKEKSPKQSGSIGIRGFKELREEDRAQSEKITSQMEQLIQHFGQIAVQGQTSSPDVSRPQKSDDMDVDTPKLAPVPIHNETESKKEIQSVKMDTTVSPIKDFSKVKTREYSRVYIMQGEVVYIK